MIRMFDQHKVRFQKELEGYWEFTKVQSKATLPKGYNSKLFVPGCWENNIQMIDYRGYGAYRKTITFDKASNIRLNFKGVSHTADVYFDGKHIAHHYNAFTEFSVNVPRVSEGKHEVVVIADNTFTEKSSLHIPNDYYCYGGIIKPVVLEAIADVYIKNISFTPIFSNGKWSSDIKIILENISDKPYKVNTDILLNDAAIISKDNNDWIDVSPNSETVLNFSKEFDNVKEWTAQTPNLYMLKVQLYEFGDDSPIDDLIDRVGFRTITVKDSKFLLNGEPIFIQGFNRHEDFATSGCSIPMQLAAIDMDLMKDMNANAVRTCHYPNDERFLDMCDEQGIFVWEENHARGFKLDKMLNPNFERQCEDCIDEMITSHYNHPAIIIWGILNECASETLEGRRMYEKQFEQIKSMDKSRPVTFATCRHFNDICLDLVDIVSINIYYGWYGEEKNKEEIEQSYLKELEWINSTEGKGKPIIISEFGGGAIYGTHSPTRCKWSEERQYDILKNTLSIYLNRSEICGTYIWQFADCRVTDEVWGIQRPRTMNNKGVVDEYRRPKLSYSIVKELFGEKLEEK
jgi:beta-glucuronidase